MIERNITNDESVRYKSVREKRKLLIKCNIFILFMHIFREANRRANNLAKYGNRLSKSILFFYKLISCISLDFLADSLG